MAGCNSVGETCTLTLLRSGDVAQVVFCLSGSARTTDKGVQADMQSTAASVTGQLTGKHSQTSNEPLEEQQLLTFLQRCLRVVLDSCSLQVVLGSSRLASYVYANFQGL